jgi:hypothetical protein
MSAQGALKPLLMNAGKTEILNPLRNFAAGAIYGI